MRYIDHQQSIGYEELREHPFISLPTQVKVHFYNTFKNSFGWPKRCM